jgi:hypothetical protein
MSRLRALVVVALAAALAVPHVAHADDTPKDRARARAQDAAEHLADKRWNEALEAATQAEELYHAATHLLIMGQALEGLGRLAEAADVYERLAAEPLPASAAPVFKKAQQTGNERLKDLLARVPSILVTVTGAGTAEPTATVDGKPIALGGAAVRLDAGAHELRVEAAGRRPFVQSFDLPQRGGVVKIEAALSVDSGGAPPAPPPTRFEDAAADEGGEGSLAPAVVAFSIGGAGIAVGAITGVLFLGAMGDLEERCPEDRCAPEDQEAIDEAGLLGNVSTIGFGVGAAGLVAGVILAVVRPGGGDASVSASATGIEPWIGATSGGVRGRFR